MNTRGLKAYFESLIRIVLVFCTCLLLAACGTLSNGRGWGQDATLTPGWQRVGKSAKNALLSPQTWVPLSGALLLQIDDMDGRITDWAAEQTPLFGSQGNADRFSDVLNTASKVAYWTSVLVTPSGEQPEDWIFAKCKGIAVGVTARSLTIHTTGFLKNTTKRTRPDTSNDQSFPSGHTSHSSIYTTLASKNLDAIPLPNTVRTALKFGVSALTVGTGWARIEGHRHYPSDVLVGMALGHVLGTFFTDAFLGLELPEDIAFTVESPGKRGRIGVRGSF